MREVQMMYDNLNALSKNIQKDIEKYKSLYSNAMTDARAELRNVPEDKRKELREILDEIEVHSKNRNSSGLLDVLSRVQNFNK